MVSTRYIEMCKTPEIQGQWQPKVGDMVLYCQEIYYITSHPTNDVCDLSHWSVSFSKENPPCIVSGIEYLTWIPYQHQIQGMFKMRNSELWLCFEDFLHYLLVVDDTRNFDVLWLQAYMWIIHKKRWNIDNKWVTEK